MAIRILVADDEEFERRALRHILGAAELDDVEIVEASNGREVLEAAAAGRLDVVFLDIRMPGIDGMEAAKHLRESHPGLPIVFLTAYDRFDYARNALRLHVDDFLLKPASEPEVLGALTRALAANREGPVAGEDRVASAAVFLADAIRSDLGMGRVSEAGIDRYRSLAGKRESLVAAVCLRPGEAMGLGGGGTGKAGTLKAGAAALERAFLAAGFEALAGAGADRALCIVFASKAELAGAGGIGHSGSLRDSILRGVEGALASVRDGLGISLFAGASFAEGGGLPLPGDLARAASTAVSVAGGGRTVVLAPIAASGGNPADQASEAGEARDHGGRSALRALSLMEERLAEDLSLEAVAVAIGLSPSHLSRLLAKRTGMGFSDCLSRFRVERAKAYLAAGSTSVKEVALLVGFRDPAYFARVFKRFSGTSPAEYRSGIGPSSPGKDDPT